LIAHLLLTSIERKRVRGKLVVQQIANSFLHIFSKPKDITMNKNTRTAAALLLVITFSLLSSACHTMAGIGKDTQEVGEEIKETAEGN
jgi:predicted small secreted protein